MPQSPLQPVSRIWICRVLAALALTVIVTMILPAQTAYAGNGLANQLVVPSAQEMTRSLTALIVQYQHAAAPAQGVLLAPLVELAEARQQLLAALIADEPATVLHSALPATVRASLPPRAQAYIEQA